MIKKLKKGFTLVELVVVIAVIAILSAVSVVTYVSITNKAHQSANEQLVTQFNNIIKGDADIKAPHDALKMLEAKGTKLANLDPEQKEKYQFAYHSTAKRVIIMNADSTKILFPADLKKDSLSNADKVAIFKFAKETSSLGYLNTNGFSYYLADDGFEGTLNIKTGVDVGENDDVSLTYNNSTGSRQDVILRTNSSEAIVNVTAYKNSDETNCDKVEHFGEAKEVIGNVCGLSSLHEFGKVVDLDIFQGRVVLEEGHDVNTVISRSEDVIIETKSSQPEHAYGAGHDTNSGNVPLDEIGNTDEDVEEAKESAEQEVHPSGDPYADAPRDAKYALVDDEGGIYYQNHGLEEALSGLNNYTLVLLEDVDMPYFFQLRNTYTFDLHGHVMDLSHETDGFGVVESTVTIIDSDPEHKGTLKTCAFEVMMGDSLTIESGNIRFNVGEYSPWGGQMADWGYAGSITMNGGTVNYNPAGHVGAGHVATEVDGIWTVI